MQITEQVWAEYVRKLAQLDEEAGAKMAHYIDIFGTDNPDNHLVTYAQALIEKYGAGSAELACQMYDELARLSGVDVPPAVPAEPASYSETAKMVWATLHSPALLRRGVSRLVKQAGADTTLKNALRDGAEFAWVPHGDTCPFCITLASRGWQRASKKAIKNGHAEHIHANCDCTYAIRFDHSTTVAGYDPEAYLAQYRAAGGDINAMRREQYAKDRKRITAQKRAAYAARRLRESSEGGIVDYSKAIFAGKHDITWHMDKHRADFDGWTEEEYLQRARELLTMPLQDGELEEITRSDGSVSRYCYSTNEFVASTDDGNIRTFFRPKNGKEYWDDEYERN